MIYIVVVNIRHTGKGSGIHFASLGKRILSCNFFGGGSGVTDKNEPECRQS